MLQKIERSLMINFCSYTYQKTIVQGTKTVRMATLGLEAAPSCGLKCSSRFETNINEFQQEVKLLKMKEDAKYFEGQPHRW